MRYGNDIVALLGRPSDDPEVEALLRQFQIRWPPVLDPPEEDLDDDAFEPDWYVWRPSSPQGIEFGFQDEAHLLALDRDFRGSGRLILHSVCFYGDHEGVNRHAHPLPYGLGLADSRAAVRQKLTVLETEPRSHRRDTWDPPPHRIVVEHTRRDVIDSALFKLRLHPWPPLDEDPPNLPTIPEIVGLFGLPWYADPFRERFFPLGLERCGPDIAKHRYADLREERGCELYFFRDPSRPADSPIKDKGALFGGIKFYAPRFEDARGWAGALPFGLTFQQAYPSIVKTVGKPPDAVQDESLSGFAVWNLPDFTMHVLYDNVDNLVRTVGLFRPGSLRLL